MDLRYPDQFVHVVLVYNIRARLQGLIHMTVSAHSVWGDSICVMNGGVFMSQAGSLGCVKQGQWMEDNSREDDV